MQRLCKPLKHKSGVSIPNWGLDRGQGALQPLGCPSEQVGDAGVSSLDSGTHQVLVWSALVLQRSRRRYRMQPSSPV